MQEVQQASICQKCSAQVFGDATFCSTCGARLSLPSSSDRLEVLKTFANDSLRQVEVVARELLQTKGVQKIAGGAALGAGVAIVVPFLTIPVGATLGAAYVAYKYLKRD